MNLKIRVIPHPHIKKLNKYSIIFTRTKNFVAGYSISKTSFLKFEQCPKAFFFYKNLPYLRDKPTVDKLLTFKRGHDVGYFGQQLFPGGTDVSKITDSADTALKKTL